MNKLCKTCGKEFEGRGNSRYCSEDCWRTERRIQGMYDFLKHREERLIKTSQYAKDHPEKFYEYTKTQRAKFPEKSRAKAWVSVNKLRGKIVYPDVCPKCGSSGKIHAHHPDYSKPKEIEFMCAQCHKDEHRKLNIGETH